MGMREIIKSLGLEPVDDISGWQSWWSTKMDAIAIALGSIAVAYSQLPDDWQQALPAWVLTVLASSGLAVKSLALILRGAKQPNLPAPRDSDGS